MPRYEDERIVAYGLFIKGFATVHRHISESMEERAGLPLPWFELLLRIAQSDDGRLKMSELARHLFLTTGGVTRLVDRIVEAGLVVRQPCPTDRRVQWVGLTDLGHVEFERAVTCHLADLDRCFIGPLSADELAALTHTLAKLADAIDSSSS